MTSGRKYTKKDGTSTVSTVVQLDSHDLEMIKQIANDECRTVSSLVKFVVKEYLKTKTKEYNDSLIEIKDYNDNLFKEIK